MKTPDYRLRAATKDDLPAILGIYNRAVATTAIWMDAPADLADRRQWFEGRRKGGFPVLAAVAGTTVLGYGSYGPFRAFDGYRQTVEHSLYVAEDARRRGVGSALLAALESEARKGARVHVMIGAIAADNEASLRLHARHRFAETARMPQVGIKFGHYLDLVFMQKILSNERG